MTTQTRTAQAPHVDFYVHDPWRTIIDLAMQVADHKVTTGEDSPEATIVQLRTLIASVKPSDNGNDPTKKSLWGQFARFVKNRSCEDRFTTTEKDPKERHDTGNLVHSLIFGYHDWNLEAFKDVSRFVGVRREFDVNTVPWLIERAKAKFGELKGVDRLQAMRDLEPKIDKLVEFVERRNAKRSRRDTGVAVNAAADGLRAERDGTAISTTANATDTVNVVATTPTADVLVVEPMEVTTTSAAIDNAPAPNTDATEPTLEEQALDLQKRIDKLFGEADALRATDKRSKDATAKETEAFKLEDELKAVRGKIDERDREAARVAEAARIAAEEAERGRAAVEAARLAAQPEPVPAAAQTTAAPVFQPAASDPMAQIRAAAKAGDELAKAVLAGYAAGKHPTAERAIQVARDLGVIS